MFLSLSKGLLGEPTGLRTQWRMAHFFAAFLTVDRTVLDNNNIRQTGQNREYST